MTTATPPADKIDLVHIEETETGLRQVQKTHFMSQGLLNRFLKLIPNPQMTLVADMDPEFIDMMLNELYAPRRQAGQKIDPEFQHPDMSIAESSKALCWIKEHVLGFFLNQLAHTRTMWEANKDGLEAIASSMTGSAGSRSSKPSSGPSDADPVT